jgi:Glycosyl transferase family 11
MIIVKSNGGQMCNRIWSYSSMIAYSLKHHSLLYIVDFDEYISCFENLNLIPNVHIVTNKYIKKLLKLLPRVYSKVFPRSHFNYFERYIGVSNCFGWDYRSESSVLSDYREIICQLFSPKQKVINRCADFISSHKVDRILVGVHIRRRDYINHLDGIYYFENSVYLNKMMALREAIFYSTNKEVTFIICSDESIVLSDFDTIECHQLNDATGVEDLYTLSLCDYLIGPPSTFSMWASFYGNVPLCILSSKSQDVALNQFKIISAVDKFADGDYFEHTLIS